MRLPSALDRSVEGIRDAVATVGPHREDVVATAGAADVVAEIGPDVGGRSAPVRSSRGDLERGAERVAAVQRLRPECVHKRVGRSSTPNAPPTLTVQNGFEPVGASWLS